MAHLATSPRFRGIRHAAGFDDSPQVRNSHTHPPKDLYLDPTFRDGFAQLQPLGLSFDAWLYHPQLATVVDLARTFPSTAIILDHVGGPLGVGPYAGQREEIRREWLRSIRALSELENVSVKLGGLGMPICGFDFHKRPVPPDSATLAAAWSPYILPCIELFGVHRCMFESNFPVDRVSCSYTVLWNAFKRLAEGAGDDEKGALFGKTARRVYRI